VSHSPPKSVPDVDARGRSPGSAAVRDTVRRLGPRLVVYGHIHACGGRQGHLGRAPVVNARRGGGGGGVALGGPVPPHKATRGGPRRTRCRGIDSLHRPVRAEDHVCSPATATRCVCRRTTWPTSASAWPLWRPCARWTPARVSATRKTTPSAISPRCRS